MSRRKAFNPQPVSRVPSRSTHRAPSWRYAIEFLESARLAAHPLPRDQADMWRALFQCPDQHGDKSGIVLAVAVERYDNGGARRSYSGSDRGRLATRPLVVNGTQPGTLLNQLVQLSSGAVL